MELICVILIIRPLTLSYALAGIADEWIVFYQKWDHAGVYRPLSKSDLPLKKLPLVCLSPGPIRICRSPYDVHEQIIWRVILKPVQYYCKDRQCS